MFLKGLHEAARSISKRELAEVYSDKSATGAVSASGSGASPAKRRSVVLEEDELGDDVSDNLALLGQRIVAGAIAGSPKTS